MTASRSRYASHATMTRLPLLLPGAVTVWEGRRAVVVDVEERVLDDGRWAVRLAFGDGGRPVAVGGPAEAQLPVFTDPYPVCSCHGEPWPCDDQWARDQQKRAQMHEGWKALARCAACGQERNLGRVRYMGAAGSVRFCRRVGCVREAERRERALHNERHQEFRERQEFAESMRQALGDGAPQ